jgi:hypothetical protein
MVVRFVAFDKLNGIPHIIVDSGETASTELVLSHWPGVQTPVLLKSDLSAGVVMNYLRQGYSRPEVSVVSTSHFDVDGLVSVYAIVNPEQAMKHRRLWLDVACAGDFRYSRSAIARRIAAVCDSWVLPDRSPLGAKAFHQPIDRVTEMLFQDLLSRLDEICRNLQRYKSLWEETEDSYAETWKMVKSGLIAVEEYDDQELSIIRLSDNLINRLADQHQSKYFGLSEFAIHEIARHFTILLRLDRYYQVTQRYESWVQYCSRPIRLRRDFAALVELLNELEGDKWRYEGVWKLVPVMSLASQQQSQLDESKFISLVCSFLKLAPVAWNPSPPAINNPSCGLSNHGVPVQNHHDNCYT